jgi:hypothetical protein
MGAWANQAAEGAQVFTCNYRFELDRLSVFTEPSTLHEFQIHRIAPSPYDYSQTAGAGSEQNGFVPSAS